MEAKEKKLDALNELCEMYGYIIPYQLHLKAMSGSTSVQREKRIKLPTTNLSVVFLSVSSKVHDHVCCISNNSSKDEHATKVRKDAEQQAHRGLRRNLFACTHSCHGYQGTKQAVKVLWTDLGKQMTHEYLKLYDWF